MRMVESIHELLGNGGAALRSSQRKAASLCHLCHLWLQFSGSAALAHLQPCSQDGHCPRPSCAKDAAHTPWPSVLKIKDLEKHSAASPPLAHRKSMCGGFFLTYTQKISVLATQRPREGTKLPHSWATFLLKSGDSSTHSTRSRYSKCRSGTESQVISDRFSAAHFTLTNESFSVVSLLINISTNFCAPSTQSRTWKLKRRL